MAAVRHQPPPPPPLPPPAPPRRPSCPRRRPAAVGMIEVLILTGIGVTTVGVLGIWLGIFDEGGWRTGGYHAHCTMDITLFEDVGGGFNYLEVYLVNTGTRDIQSFSIVTGGTPHTTSNSTMPPGDSYGFVHSATNLRPEHVAGQAAYSDGSTALCVNKWDRGVVG